MQMRRTAGSVPLCLLPLALVVLLAACCGSADAERALLDLDQAAGAGAQNAASGSNGKPRFKF